METEQNNKIIDTAPVAETVKKEEGQTTLTPRPTRAPYQGNQSGNRVQGTGSTTGGYRGNNSNSGNTGGRSFGGPNAGGNRFGSGGSKFGGRPGDRRNSRVEAPKDDFTAEVITVRRVTRVVKGGKRMRFAALVVVGDGKGLIGFANKKGMDFQDAVAKATKKAKENVIKVQLTDDFTVPFSTFTKFKAAKIMLKPAPAGTSLIAGGYIRPVLQLVGVKNIYSKILGSNNKVVGVEAVINALANYSVPTKKTTKVINKEDSEVKVNVPNPSTKNLTN
jgi:small subunit ribosomal protein S5